MTTGWLWGSLGAAAIVLFIGGYLVGFAVYQPDVSSLEAETEEQQDELASLRSRLSDRDAQLEALVNELSDVKAARVGIETSLESARSFLAEARASAEQATADLREARSSLAETESQLALTQADKTRISEQLAAMQTAQNNLDRAIKVQSELQEIFNTELGPNHGDALLLIQEGLRAAIDGNFAEAAIFFDESSMAFSLAKANAEVAAAKGKDLKLLVPSKLNKTFDTSHRQSESTVLAMEAQAKEYQGASVLYVIIGEWNDVDQEGSAADKERWRGMANEAEDLLEQAMTMLDEADAWAPGLWRRSEAIRLDIRQWQDLLRGVRGVIIDPVQ